MYTVVIMAFVCIHVHAVSSLRILLDTITTYRPCSGNPDPLFLRLPNIRDAVLKDHSSKYLFVVCMYMYIHVHIACTCIPMYTLLPTGSKVVAVVDSLRTGDPSIYHVECEILVSSSTERCSSCSRHRRPLRVMASRSPRDERTHPSSHTPYVALNTPEKDERLRRLHLETKKAKLCRDRLRQKLEEASTQAQVTVDKTLDDDIRSLAAENTEVVNRTHPEGSFQRIFWEQQR